MRTVTVRVTARDIAAGDLGNALRCALSLAIGRATKQSALVAGDRLWLDSTTADGAIELPVLACDFYHRFDAGDTVSPIVFTLDLPD